MTQTNIRQAEERNRRRNNESGEWYPTPAEDVKNGVTKLQYWKKITTLKEFEEAINGN